MILTGSAVARVMMQFLGELMSTFVHVKIFDVAQNRFQHQMTNLFACMHDILNTNRVNDQAI